MDIARKAEGSHLKVVTTNYVIAELVALLTSRLRISRPQILRVIDLIKASPNVVIAHVTPEIDAEAWTPLKERPDKDWSLVDASSFVVMNHRGITEALTTDHHFDQANFVMLPHP
ncbi:MAG: type II toxin-antitoxin system VapC family toxin [Ktedonobacterales bacterium]